MHKVRVWLTLRCVLFLLVNSFSKWNLIGENKQYLKQNFGNSLKVTCLKSLTVRVNTFTDKISVENKKIQMSGKLAQKFSHGKDRSSYHHWWNWLRLKAKWYFQHDRRFFFFFLWQKILMETDQNRVIVLTLIIKGNSKESKPYLIIPVNSDVMRQWNIKLNSMGYCHSIFDSVSWIRNQDYVKQ